MLLLAALAKQAGSLQSRALGAAAESVTYAGPRGELRLRDRHIEQRVYLAQADALRFDIVAEL